MSETFIAKDERLPDYFIRLNRFEDIRNHYERGKLLIFDNLEFFKPYKEFLNNQVISFRNEELPIKKIKGPQLLKPIDKEHPILLFTKKPWDLQKIILETYVFVKQSFFEMFPHYRVHSENWTWRLTITKNDVMHLDSYSNEYNHLHNVRIFINLDCEPRVWRTTYLLPEMYRKFSRYIKELPVGTHPNIINERLNKRVKWDELPFHEIYFAPYSMWVCDSQYIPHQGLRGNKLAAYTFRIEPETMLHPELVFEKVGNHYSWEALNQ